jgi:hypothetical protein
MGSLADIELRRTEAPQCAIPPQTAAGVYLCRRSCINPMIADLVAALAGLGPDRKAA